MYYTRSDFLGTKYQIYDSQPPYEGAKASNSRSTRRFGSKRISPQVPSANYETGYVHYKFNLLKSRGPRRMHCILQSPITSSSTEQDLQLLDINEDDATKLVNKPQIGMTSGNSCNLLLNLTSKYLKQGKEFTNIQLEKTYLVS